MLIKHAALPGHLKHAMSAVYLLIGNDPYLINESALMIKQAWKARHDTDFSYVSLQQSTDWQTLIEEAYHYSLFSEAHLIQANFDKKSFDNSAKQALTQYLKKPNEKSLIVIQAPLLTAKAVQVLTKFPELTIVQMVSLTQSAMLQWVAQALKNKNFQYTPEVINTIVQFTIGNHLACAQVIEKLAMVHPPGHLITRSDVLDHLSDQCEYQLYELADACLTGNSSKAIHLIRNAAEHKTEANLILWLLTQEIRLLIQLNQKLSCNTPLPQAGTALKIWPQRLPLYQKFLQHISQAQLFEILRFCQQVDEGFKTGKNKQIWECIEQIAIKLIGICYLEPFK